MRDRETTLLRASAFLLLLALSIQLPSALHAEAVDFESDAWNTENAQVTEYMGRQALAGRAFLTDLAFENGTIEFDLIVTRARSYPGVFFRIQSPQDYERIYIRPHRLDFYPDAIQYTPTINGIAGWQLYNGDGFTSGLSVPYDEWFHVKLVVAGSQARLYIGESDVPSLAIDDLKHGVSKGSIALDSPADGSAYFSNFQYTMDDDLELDPAPPVETPPGTFTTWDLSQSFKLLDVDLELPLSEQDFGEIQWSPAESDASGLVDVARYMPRTGQEPDCVFAKTTIRADTARVMELQLGYSDFVSVYLNDRILFSGNSAYRVRDPSFLGIVGLNDYLFLPLREGENELALLIVESFGGWGFICRDGDAVFEHDDVKKALESSDDFLTPESVVFDPERDVFYVSNFDAYNRAGLDTGQFISRVSKEGDIVDRRWVTGLARPTGMAISGGTLYVVERGGVAAIDIESAQITHRHRIPQPGFPNDVTVDSEGRIYVSDSQRNVIYRFAGGEFEDWLTGDHAKNPNALFVQGNTLLFGSSGDRRVKAADLETGEVGTVAQLGPGFIDGIRVDPEGNYLVSLWEGKVYRITPSGALEKILDTSVPGVNAADFEYVAGERLLVIPTYMDNRLVSYRVGG